MAKKPTSSTGSLAERLLGSGAKDISSSVLMESEYYQSFETIPTQLPAYNIILSGDMKGGISPGITIVSGESGTGKTLFCWMAAKTFMDKYPEGMVLYYDTEFGALKSYFETMDIDMDRVIHIPVYNIEQWKFDMVSRFEEMQPSDKVFVLVDSLGLMASKKEVEDAENEKSAADMTRAKAIRSAFRITLPHINIKGIHLFAINHSYDEMGSMYPQKILGGGKAVKLVANNVLMFSKSKEREGTDLVGFNINITSFKSRFVKENSKVSILLKFDGGFDQFTGIVDLAVAAGCIVKPNAQFYQFVDDTGEILYEGKKFRLKEIENAQYLVPIMRTDKFKNYVRETYQLVSSTDKKILVQEFNINDL